MARSTRLVILIKNIYILWGRIRFLQPVTYLPPNIVYPFTLRVTGINMFARPKIMNKCFIMPQNKLLTFCIESKLQVRRMENISFTEICRLLGSCWAVVISTPIMGRVGASSQVMGRCAWTGSSSLNPFYDMFVTHM